MTGPSYPQQHWPPPPPLARPPRRRGGAIGALLVALLLVIAGGITFVLVNNKQGASSVRNVPAATSTRSGSTPKSARPKTSPTPRTTATTRPRAATTASRTPTKKPAPQQSPTDLLQRNALYRIPALVDAGCAAGADASFDSIAGVRAFYSSVMPCLASAWSQLRTSKLPFRAPRLVVHSGESTPCGALSYSFYCPTEQTIYMYAPEMITPWQQFPSEEGRRNTRLAALHTIAHEYGHHIQYLTGIFGALGSDWPGTPSERALELQATCFGNAFLASQQSAYPISSNAFADEKYWRFITGLPNHGTVANQKLWSERGYENKKPSACNTFGAPPTEIA